MTTRSEMRRAWWSMLAIIGGALFFAGLWDSLGRGWAFSAAGLFLAALGLLGMLGESQQPGDL